MNSEITISADELFYLGKLMNAKYIDYAYIVCLNDSADDFQIREKVVKQALIKKEFVFESFSGNIDIEESVTSLLLPVFNGKKEVSLNLCTIQDQAKADVFKFHFLNEKITYVKAENGLLKLKAIQRDEIERIVSEIFFDESEFTDKSMSVVNELTNVSALFSAKSLVLEEHSVVYVFVKSEGIWYMDKGHNVFESIQREELIDLVVRLFKG